MLYRVLAIPIYLKPSKMGNAHNVVNRELSDSSCSSNGNINSASSLNDQHPVQAQRQQVSQPPSAFGPQSEFPVVLKWSGPANQVFVCGSWNNWSTKIPLVKSNGDYSTIVNVPEGRHEYKFLVDDQWKCDNAAKKIQNKFGIEKNVMIIDKVEFEVLNTLEPSGVVSSGDHSLHCASALASKNSLFSLEVVDTSSLEFGQDFPDINSFAFCDAPPELPPDLLEMPKLALEIKANLEAITNLQAIGDDFRWYLKIKCGNCGELPDHWQYITLEEKHDIDGSRGTAHLVSKCKLCSRPGQISILPDHAKKYIFDKNNQFQKIIAFDCRGLEPVDFDPRIGWTAEGVESGTIFSDIDLSEKEWAEFDEKVAESVGIYELESRFVHVK